MGRWGVLIAAVLAALAAFAAPSAARADSAAVTRCSAAVPDRADPGKWLAAGPRWTCPADFSALSHNAHAVRFRWDGQAGGEAPVMLVSRTAAFESLTIFTRAATGDWQAKTHRFSDIRPTYLERSFAVPLPELGPGADEIVVVVAAPTQAIPLDYMRLASEAPGASQADFAALLLIALVCGLILTPLLFDFVFYRVLREPFILWHGVFVICIALQLTLTAGLFIPFTDMSLGTLRFMTVASFGAMVVASMMFIASFVEKDMLGPRMRRLLLAGAALEIAVTLLHAQGLTVFGPWPARIFYGAGIPAAAIIVAAVYQAWRRGSRYVRYVIIGLTPLFLVAMARVVSFLLPGIPTADFNALFHAGVLIEAIATALGVASRFVQLKRERDEARSEAHTLENLAGQDPLTGLFNRRAIEPRFGELYKAGYETIALIDLDHFKRVNDTLGHAKGDEVLRAAAKAMKTEPHTLAARIGGEEFMLLLQGEDGLERAEHARRAITARVASEVAGLDGPVTASMGVVCVPQGTLPRARFADLSAMADKLLYEAKEQGRNRYRFEKLRGFEPRKRERRRRAA